MKKITLIILMAAFSLIAAAQCPDSATVNTSVVFYYNGGNAPPNSFNYLELDTFDGTNTVTLTLNRVSRTNDSISVSTVAGLTTNTTYTAIRYYNGGGVEVGTACNTQGALPVTLVSFEGINKNNTNIITWITSMEYNCRFFELKKKDVILKFNCTNTNEIVEYTFIDDSINNINIYELSQEDWDGTREHLGVIKVQNFSKEDLYEVINYGILHIRVDKSGNKTVTW